MTQIKIAFVIDQLSLGGTEKQLIELINMLDRKQFVPILFMLRNNIKKKFNQINCEKYCLNINSLKEIVSTQKFLKFVLLLKRKKIDILQTFFPDSTLIGVISSKITFISKIIITRRDMGFWHKRKTKIYYRIANRFADKWIVNSYGIKNYLIKKENIDRKKIKVIFNGIRPEHYLSDSNKKYKCKKEKIIIIGVISNFNRYVKRLDIFLKAMNMLYREHKNISFLVVGNIENKHWNIDFFEYEKRNFIFAGEVSDVREYLKIIDIGIVTSDSEGFSNVILEYMASSIPCVCSDSGGNLEIIKDGVNGLFFNKGDAKSLYEKVSFMLKNPLLRKQFVKNAKKIVSSQYNWKNIIKQYESYYKTIMIK